MTIKHLIIRAAAIIAIATSAIPALHAQQQLRLAVLDPVVSGEALGDGIRISVREIVSSTFVNSGANYSIVERSLLDKIIQEANFSNSDAVDESQATQLGKLAGADKVVLTVVSRIESRCLFSIKLINVETATIDRQQSKLVDYSSLLDVAEPLTLAVLGMADAAAIPSRISSDYAATAPTADKQKKGGGLISKNQSAAGAGSSTTATAADGPIEIPEFSGSGLAVEGCGLTVDRQPNEFWLEKFGQLVNNHSYNVIFDFGSATVLGRKLPDYVVAKSKQNKSKFDSTFYNRLNSETQRFIEAFNDNSKDYKLTYDATAPIALVVRVVSIDEPGRNNTADYMFVETATGNVITGMRMEAEGGRFGSFTNLFGDAMEEAGEDIAKKFNNFAKRYKKKYK